MFLQFNSVQSQFFFIYKKTTHLCVTTQLARQVHFCFLFCYQTASAPITAGTPHRWGAAPGSKAFLSFFLSFFISLQVVKKNPQTLED